MICAPSWHRPAFSATMTRMTVSRVVAAIAATAALTLTGCTSAPPSPERATMRVPVEVTTPDCEINYDGPVDEPTWLHVDCETATWSLPGPWVDHETEYLDDGADPRGGWRFTKAVIVGGDARAWLATDTSSCVATRDLLEDSAEETLVRCHIPDIEPAPTEESPAPPPPAASPIV